MSSEVYATMALDRAAAAERARRAAEERERERQRMLADLDAPRRLLEQARRAAQSGGKPHAGVTKLDGVRRYDYDAPETQDFSDDAVRRAEIAETDQPTVHGEMLYLSDRLADRQSPAAVRKSEALKHALERLAGGFPAHEAAHEALRAFLNFAEQAVSDDALDPVFYERSLDARLHSLMPMLRFLSPEEAEAEADYLGLCRLLGVEPAPLDSAARAARIQEMNAELLRRREDAYIADALKESLAELGMEVVGSEVLDGLSGVRLVDPDAPNMAVFMSLEGDGLLLETIAIDEGADTPDQEQLALREAGAKRMCQQHRRLIELMRQKGVILRADGLNEPDAARMRTEAPQEKRAPDQAQKPARRRKKRSDNQRMSEE